MLKLKDISAQVSKNEKILEKINIAFKKNTLNLILGPNAAGKTTLAEIIAGSVDVKVTGKIFFNGEDITKKKLEQRVKLGILLMYQNPVEIPGVKVFDFLFASYKTVRDKNICVWDFHEIVLEKIKTLNLQEEFLQRNVNEGFSGGEKKKFEILQMLLLKPNVIILDEIDSGLDIDSIKEIFKIIIKYQKQENATVILISHAHEILKYVSPDQVILLQDKIIKEKGDIRLAKRILKDGYK